MGKKTAEKVTEGVDASPLTIIVTGGTNGLGKETVRVLAKRGAHVYLAARNLSAAEKVKEGILKETPGARIDLLKIDLASLESVRTAAKEFLALNVPLNVLVCNAGIVSPTNEFSVDNVELNFATNYLGHVLLTQLLLDKLKETATESGIEGRIVNVSSLGHEVLGHKEGIRFDEVYNVDKSNVKKVSLMERAKNYGQSKLAQILYTQELAQRLQDEGINNVTVNSLHPGTARTNITTPAPAWIKRKYLCYLSEENNHSIKIDLVHTGHQGAGLQTYLAISPDVKGVSGKYFDNYKVYPLKEKNALDEELQKKLWDFSMKLISA